LGYLRREIGVGEVIVDVHLLALGASLSSLIRLLKNDHESKHTAREVSPTGGSWMSAA
jgi:hypothetical protein